VTCSRSQLLCCHTTIEENKVSSTSASFNDLTSLMAKHKMTKITTIATQTNPKILLLQAVYIKQAELTAPSPTLLVEIVAETF